MESKALPSVAFLGPLGTFSHQVAYNYFGDGATYLPRPSIANVFASLSREIPFVCMPLANSTHGAVIETMDLFRSHRWSKDAFIRDEITLKIEHCLVIASEGDGDEEENLSDILESITCVYSHEQALGQCAGWLERHLPHAMRVKTDSTAGAAKKLVDVDSKARVVSGREAAICSEICLQTQAKVKLVARDIQDRADNQTRFVIVSYDLVRDFPPHKWNGLSRTLLRISPREDNLSRILSLLSSDRVSKDVTVKRIDRRPALEGETWLDAYFAELWRAPSTENQQCVDELVDSLVGLAEAVILGRW